MATVATVLVAAALIAAVFSAVHHAEVVAHQVGEPFGTLILAVAVTVIEAALIVSMMLAGGDKAAAIARDSTSISPHCANSSSSWKCSCNSRRRWPRAALPMRRPTCPTTPRSTM